MKVYVVKLFIFVLFDNTNPPNSSDLNKHINFLIFKPSWIFTLLSLLKVTFKYLILLMNRNKLLHFENLICPMRSKIYTFDLVSFLKLQYKNVMKCGDNLMLNSALGKANTQQLEF